MIRPLTIRQTEYAFATKKSEYRDLITRGILVCTVVFGIDKQTGVAFIAHFDLPWTTNELHKIVDEAREKAGIDSQFEIQVINGNMLISILYLFSAFFTRFWLKRNIAKCNNLKVVRDHGFTLRGLKRDVLYSSTIENIKVLNRYNFFTVKEDKSKTRKMNRSKGSA